MYLFSLEAAVPSSFYLKAKKEFDLPLNMQRLESVRLFKSIVFYWYGSLNRSSLLLGCVGYQTTLYLASVMCN